MRQLAPRLFIKNAELRPESGRQDQHQQPPELGAVLMQWLGAVTACANRSSCQGSSNPPIHLSARSDDVSAVGLPAAACGIDLQPCRTSASTALVGPGSNSSL
jgi:hypothetical protein